MDCSLLGSSIHGISQARILEWLAISYSRGSSQTRGWAWVSCIGRQILYHWVTREARSSVYPNTYYVFSRKKVLAAQSCLTLCDPMDCSLPGSSVHEILQVRNTGVGSHSLLQGIFMTWGSNPGPWHSRQILCHLSHQGSQEGKTNCWRLGWYTRKLR